MIKNKAFLGSMLIAALLAGLLSLHSPLRNGHATAPRLTAAAEAAAPVAIPLAAALFVLFPLVTRRQD